MSFFVKLGAIIAVIGASMIYFFDLILEGGVAIAIGLVLASGQSLLGQASGGNSSIEKDSGTYRDPNTVREKVKAAEWARKMGLS